ncbi:MAG: hypothetical protein D6802_05950 [Ardenticatenia bacterium]|nr:MAG: hypothetical protein D6802_05950 [Ardenticatenia bacterium]
MRFLVLGLLALGLVACGASPAPTVDVIAPVNGQRIPTGREVGVHVRANAPHPLDRVEFYANRELFAVLIPPHATTTFEGVAYWVPPTAGAVRFDVRAFDRFGHASMLTTVVVEAVGEPLR